MSPSETFGPADEQIRIEAADWFARMRSPEADGARLAFEAWYAVPSNKRAYEQMVGRWEQSAFIAASRVGRERHLGRASFVARHPVLSMAAALVVVIGTGSLVVTEFHSRSALATAERAQAPLRFESGDAVRDIALSDGSRVTLDKASLILVSFSPTQRIVELARGRARFHPVGDPKRPFRVKAGAGEVFAETNAFDVALQDRTAEISPVSGSVSVRSHLSAATRLVLVSQRIFVPESAPMPAPAAAMPGASDWLPRMIALDHTSLGDAALQVGRDAPHQILFADDASALQITGTFRSGDVDELAAAAQAMFHLNRRRDFAGNILLSRGRASPEK